MVIQTKEFDGNNQIIVPTNSDDIPMVNATINPYLDVPAQIVRFRLLNGSSQRVFNIGISNNIAFYQIASDGGLLGAPVQLTRLRMAPGERAEILVDLKGLENQQIKLMSFASELPGGIYGAAQPGMNSMMTLNGYNPNPLNGANFDLLALNVKEQISEAINTIPDKLVTVTTLSENTSDITRNLTFNPAQMGSNQLNGNFLINNLHFDMDVINFSIPFNNTEIWSITNQSGIAHPFHIHDVQFYILTRNGIKPGLNEQGRKDVILIEPMETIRFITQFTDFANDSVPYMMHCHMLVHEDGGMMLQFEVVDNTTGTGQLFPTQKELKIYPNPVSREFDEITVAGVENGWLHYELFNMNGQLFVKNSTKSTQKQFSFRVDNLNKGEYVLKVMGNTETVAGRIIVR